VDYPEDTDVLETTLKNAVPKNALRKAMGLWNYLKDRKGTLVDWNEDGEVSVHGQSIIGSHMIDLVKHAVTPLSKKRPLGYSQFYSVLREMHTPTGFLVQHDSNTQNDIQDNQSGSGYIVAKPKKGPPGQKQKQFRWIPY
jgi:hypothetical protein